MLIMKEFYERRIKDKTEWLAFINRQIEWHNKRLKESREFDKRISEKNGEKFKSCATRDHEKWRSYYYRQRKKYKAEIAEYQRKLASEN